jgi:flagellar basal-body rod protein FlgF
MDTTSYVGLSHQMVLRRQLDLIANNIANMNTTAYRRENVLFQDFLIKSGNQAIPSASRVDFVLDYGFTRDNSPGALLVTQNPLDVAISGNGYFTVQTANGETAYTRNGRFTLRADGTLITGNGSILLDENGQPITIANTEQGLKIDTDGIVRTDTGPKSRIGIVAFDDEGALERLGDGIYTGQGARPIPIGEIVLQTGTLENSNVQPISEMTQMLEVLRTYQSTTRMLDRFDELRRKGLERLGRVQ